MRKALAGDISQGKKKVGLPNAFTAWYPSVRVIERFLTNAGIQVVKTPRTTPEILKTATAVCSADFCIPVRVMVGHTYTLAREHPELDFIIIPNVCREHEGASNCSKFRDTSGVAIRSIAGTVGYLASQATAQQRQRLQALMGEEEVDIALKQASVLPPVLQPEIWSTEWQSLFNTCYSLYCDIYGLPKIKTRFGPFVPDPLKPMLAPHYLHCREAFNRAYDAVIKKDGVGVETFFKNTSKPRLAVIGRNYLHDDPLITADLKPFFRRKGCVVITPHDISFSLLREGFDRTNGFYETHRLYQSFLDLVADQVDGVVVIGAFGCHPDAFENIYFLEYARARGLPAWLFKYDEQSSSAGFATRYETILGFLEQRRDQRLKRTPQFAQECLPKTPAGSPTSQPGQEGIKRKPLLLWPHMSPILDAVFEEILYQAGLGGVSVKPDLLSAEAMELGNYKYTESCCPYALSTGSMMLTIKKALRQIEQEAKERGQSKPESRRIVLLQGRGEGPCTYGWYAPLQQSEMPRIFANELAAGNHTMEMITLGGSGLSDFIKELSSMGDADRLRPFLQISEAASRPGGLASLPWWKQKTLMMSVWKAIHPEKGTLTRTARAKLDALEAIRARTLIVRAHERHRGETTSLWRQACDAMSAVHTVDDIKDVEGRYLKALEAIDQDHEIKPRVLVVGEIYVVLASFANRGTVDNLLGREGIEVVEGTTLGNFIRSSLALMKRQALAAKVQPVIDYLERHNVSLFDLDGDDARAKPFVLHEIGGDGRHSVSAARHAIEHLGVDGIVHVYPFKCMPEMIAKTALSEIAKVYGVRYLPLNFDKESDTQRLRTEVSTFAAMSKIQAEKNGSAHPRIYHRRASAEMRRRQLLGKALEQIWRHQRKKRYVA